MIRAPRLHQLARLACARIDAGHHRFEAILAAVVQAANPGAVLPDCYDRISRQMRAVALVLWGNEGTHAGSVAKALDLPMRVAQSRLQRMHFAGVVERLTRGTYRLALHAPNPKRAMPGSSEVERDLVEFVQRTGGCTPGEAARAFTCRAGTMSRRLCKLAGRGLLASPRRGWYEVTAIASEQARRA